MEVLSKNTHRRENRLKIGGLFQSNYMSETKIKTSVIEMLNSVRSIGAVSLALNSRKVLGQNIKIIFFSPIFSKEGQKNGAILSKNFKEERKMH